MEEPKKYPYRPREPFVRFHNRPNRWASLVAHRRSGKTVALVNDLLIGALECKLARPQFAFIAPTYAQAKRIAWEYLKHYARPFLKGAPNESELRVDLINHARIFLAGADNPDSLRGLYLDGAALDEFGQQRPAVWTQVIRPALADRSGWAVIAGTPAGRNHFFDLWTMALASPRWFTMMLRAPESGLLPQAELDEMRSQMTGEEYEAEMECSFAASSRGSILGRYIEEAYQHGRVTNESLYDPQGADLYVSSDIGFRDFAAWWVWQPVQGGVHLVDYFEDSGMDADGWIEAIGERHPPPRIACLWLPHDARARTFSTKRSSMERFMQAGFKVRIVPRVTTPHRIQAARKVLPRARFDALKCEKGLRALSNWAYSWNEELRVYSKEPLHDQFSHGADSFTYGALMIQELASPAPGSGKGKDTPGPMQFTLDALFAEREAALAASDWR